MIIPSGVSYSSPGSFSYPRIGSNFPPLRIIFGGIFSRGITGSHYTPVQGIKNCTIIPLIPVYASLTDVACSTVFVDRGVWLRIAKQFLSCALVRGRGIAFRHSYNSIAKCAGKDFRDGAVVPFEWVYVLCAINDCALGISPVTSYSGVRE